MYKKILVPTDFSECSEKALSVGVKFAKRFGAELQVFHASMLPMMDVYSFGHLIPDYDTLKQSFESKIEDHLKRVEKSLEAQIQPITAFTTGFNAEILIEDYANEHEIDLIVCGTHGHTGIERKLLGSVSEHIVRHSKCSVLTVHHEVDSEFPFKKICVPVDFSDESKTSLKIAEALALQWDAKLELIHIIINPSHISYMLSHIDVGDDLIELSEIALEKFAKEIITQPVAYKLNVKIKATTGYLAEFYTQQECDLVIMSTHGNTGLKKFFLGNTAETVIRSIKGCTLITK